MEKSEKSGVPKTPKSSLNGAEQKNQEHALLISEPCTLSPFCHKWQTSAPYC